MVVSLPHGVATPAEVPISPIAVVIGTRPEAVKLLGVVRALGPRAALLHTGQHYSPELAGRFDDDLGLPAPAGQLAIGGRDRDEQLDIGAVLLARAFSDLRPAAVVVQGDTNSTLAGARAASHLGVPLAHVEAGLRSFDLRMPEEHNRVEVDHLADLCLAPTEVAIRNLAAEGITGDRVVVTGNTVVDAVHALLPGPAERVAVAARHGQQPSRFVLATIHRPENTDDRHRLAAVLAELAALPMPVVLPLHPRTAAAVEAHGLGATLHRLCVTPPLPYSEFLALAATCAVLVSDSGGIQEEASVLQRPVAVVRRSTERPEVEDVFGRLVDPGSIGAFVGELLADLAAVHAHLATLPTPYGDGRASERCVEAILSLTVREPVR